MERDEIQTIAASVPASRRRRRVIERELRSHLEESRADLERDGWSSDRALEESLTRLGNVDEIAAAFGEAYNTTRRPRVGLALGLASALLLGVYGGGALAAHQPQQAHAKTVTTVRKHPAAGRTHDHHSGSVSRGRKAASH